MDPLQQLVQKQRARWQRLQVMEAVGLAVSAVLAYFLIAVVLDNAARLPVLGRWIVAAGLLAACLIGGRLLVRRWSRRKATEDEIALAIERRTGGVQNRLINALQIGRDSHGDSAAALVRDNWRQLEKQSLVGAMNSRPATISTAVAMLLVFAVVGGWLWQPARFATAATRILMPFAAIDPLYRTLLTVSPGDVEAVGDVLITVKIRGERPTEIAVLLNERDQRSSHIVPVPPGSDVVTYTIPNVQHSLAYAVRGGDFTSPYYQIDVPTPAGLARVQATYHYPAYTRLTERVSETSGDLEAVQGTRADVLFVLDHPADSATLVLRTAPSAAAAAGKGRDVSRSLQRVSETEFRGEIPFDDVVEYRLETQQKSRQPHPTAWHGVRAVPDEPPRLELAGLPDTGAVPLETALSLRAAGTDDFGLTRYGIFVRRMAAGEEGKTPAWQPVAQWESGGEVKVAQAADLIAMNLGAVEGERLELVAQGMDAYPKRAGQWVPGQVHSVIVASEGAQLQLLYEQILRSEAEITGLAASQQQLHEKTDLLVRKLDADPNADGNNPAKAKELVDWAAGQAKEQSALRETCARVAKAMPAPAGNLRLSLGMLADTEMVRVLRVFDSVPTRDDAAGRRTAFSESRATQNRTLVSLQQILDQYVHFRQDWELAHMLPFLRMLTDRQIALQDESQRRVDAKVEVAAAQRDAGVRRQAKLAELCGLAATAFSGMAERTADIEPNLATAFATASEELQADALTQPFSAAGIALAAGNWESAAKQQGLAAEQLEQILTRLQEAQTDAARRALAGLEERADSDLAAQAELEKLKAGSDEDLLDEPEGLKLTDIIHMAEVVQGKKPAGEEEGYKDNYLFPDSAVPGLQRPDTGKRQEFDILKLGTVPGKTPSFPNQSDRQGNRVKPHIQEEFEDLVGDLLEEEDEMQANYESFNLNAAFNINEPGEIGKQGGDLNSTAAAAATGNQKPPTTNVGGASRVGRQGARAHGAAVGNESINRRGRDKVQEGQERSPDQGGSVKETKSDDPQLDTSTGTGGRKVESDDPNKFSQSDAGEWTDDMVGRMDKAKDTQYIVERQGKKLDAKVAEMMRDMTGKQEQTIERLKSIRKDLKNLYLPTEHLDELIDKLQANLQSLNERPTVEVFRLQQQTLDQVRGALQVFHQAHTGFQASLPREQMVRGRVLDDPARAAPPGYEEAVRNYYSKLTAP